MDTVRVEFSDKKSRSFDRDHDPSKSLLHVLAQRLTRSSPERTCDQDCLSPSRMMLPLIARDMRRPSHLKGLPLLGEITTPDVSKIRWFMSLRSPRRRLDRNFWTNRRFYGRQLGVVQKPATHRVPRRSVETVRVARFLAPPPDAKRPS